MKCPEANFSEKAHRSDMQLYQEALSCMELIASQLEEDYDQPVVTRLYEQCMSAIHELKGAQHNPHISLQHVKGAFGCPSLNLCSSVPSICQFPLGMTPKYTNMVLPSMGSSSGLFHDSLESLLETLSLQQSSLEMRRNGPGCLRKRTLSEGYRLTGASASSGRGHLSRTVSECSSSTDRGISLEDMLMSCNVQGGSLDDIVGLDDVKQILKEAVLMPSQYPQLFQGGAKPWTRLLLYGPPGTGKTKLAKVIAAELKCKFYCVSSANILSSWIGESEKLIQELFQKARGQEGQSVIFIDEIDSLCRKRSQREDEHSRRVKTELLKQIEGIEDENSATVFLLGATNCPWDLDPAFLRRFQRRVFVSLPDREGRRQIISKQFTSVPLQLTDADWIKLLDATEGYSGADLTHLTMAAAFQPIRELQSSRYWRFTKDNKITPCSSDTLGAMQYTLNKLPADMVITVLQ
ncbi:uncharacterized protein LOC135201642 isoform X3 [Macrobrachium nipponense]|uniref:uncharacterized protein LOC135201642 isoform X3 n=1 Tax=Macrobrachium nipponense TaxID=159736 RepID=UPI0030C7A9CA